MEGHIVVAWELVSGRAYCCSMGVGKWKGILL